MFEGYNIILTLAPKVLAGKFLMNLALTKPLLPWVLATLPQMTLILEPLISLEDL